jgi:F-type H+-transporting ATPase subunit epsilon
MATSGTFQCSVITPERKVLECDATFVAFPAHDGEMGMLTGRAPLICKLGIGALRIEGTDANRDGEESAGAGTHILFVDGGFAQVFENRLTLLTEQARNPQELDAGALEQALVEARAMKITDEASFTARDKAIKRAQVQLELATPGT